MVCELTRACVEVGRHCRTTCLDTLAYWVRTGRGTDHETFVLLVEAAECCRLAVDALVAGAAVDLAACADACASCADACRTEPDDPQLATCADGCQRCVDACRALLDGE